MKNFKAVSEKLFFTKNDPDDPRLGDWAKSIDDISQLEPENFAVIGYPDDEGIKLNGGRAGAALAPDKIREYFYKTTPSLESERVRIFDLGNIEPNNLDLKEKHNLARATVTQSLEKKVKVITLGGGHDYGHADFAAFSDFALSLGKKPFVINFDAHLDVRPDKKGEHSGTPFYKLLNEFENRIDFFEVGIQDWCNSQKHFQWAEEKGAKIITLRDIQSSGLTVAEFLFGKFSQFKTKEHLLALSVDMDFFSSAWAPGASQVFPVGMDANQFMIFWEQIVALHSPSLVSFYEASPPLDLDDRTSRLAALLTHQFIFRQLK